MWSFNRLSKNNHKYVKKIKMSPFYTRYFYTMDEYKKYINSKNKEKNK